MNFKFRFAKVSDAATLAELHQVCAEYQNGGYMHKLGKRFLKVYYRIEINNPNSIILLAEGEDNVCYGFHSGTLKAEEHFINLKKKRISLFLSLMPQMIIKPSLILGILQRYLSLANRTSKIAFGVKEGPRGEYWGWLPDHPNPVESLNLHKKWHRVLKVLGAEIVKSEVDISNDRVYKSIKLMGGEIIDEIVLPDQRKRVIVQYKLSENL